MSTLIVRLPDPSSATFGTSGEYEHVLTRDGQEAAARARAQASLLPLPVGTGEEIVAVLPAEALSWHQVTLPRGIGAGSPRLRAVLEGLLEDRLLDDPAGLHFGLQPGARAGEPIWVAACDREWLRRHLQTLESAKRPADRIVPEFAPGAEATLYAVGDEPGPTARFVATGPDGVVTLPLDAAALSLLPPSADNTPCFAEPGVAAQAESLLGRKVQLRQAGRRWHYAARAEWDFAQLDFATSGGKRAFKKLATGWGDVLRAPQWRPARWAAGLLVVLNLAGLNAWAWSERESIRTKETAVRELLARNFPNVKVIVDAPLQMEREVAALRQATGAASGRDLEAMLSALGGAMPSGRAATAIEFTGDQLRVKGVVTGEADTRTLAGNAAALGYGARWASDAVTIVPERAR